MIVRNIMNFVARRNAIGQYFFGTDNGWTNESEPLYFIGNRTNFVLAEPSPGNRLVVKGVTIIGDGNQGDVFILRQNRSPEKNVLLLAFFSAQSRAGASGSLNIKLDINEKVILNTNGRGVNDRNFVGVSFIELDNGGDLD